MKEHEIAAAVDAWAAEHRDELVKDLIELVNIKSVSEYGEGGYPMGTGCKLAADKMMTLGKKYGFAVENDDYYCVSVLFPGTEGKRELGIIGHIDVVPEGEGWHYPPYNAIERNGYVIGRGSSDNKGPTVMSLYVLRCMRDLGLRLHSDLRLIAGCNEESGMKDVTHYLQGHIPPAYTLNCDGGWAMCIGEKGILTADLVQTIAYGNLVAMEGGIVSNSVPANAWATLSQVAEDALERARTLCPGLVVERGEGGITLRVSGTAAHCFVPEHGDNAIYKLLNLLCDAGLLTGDAATKIGRLRQCFTDHYGSGLDIFHEDEISGKTTCVGGILRYRDGELSQNINVRFAITQSGELLVESLKRRCAGLGITLRNLEYSNPRYDSPEQPVIKLLLDTCRELLGDEHEPYVMGGGTHSRKFPHSLPYGPGWMTSPIKNPFGHAHGIDEAVRLEDLTQAMKVYVVALMRLDAFFEREALSQRDV